MGHESDVDTNYNWYTRKISKRTGRITKMIKKVS